MQGVRVAVVGTGLIGGSLGMALRGRPGVEEVVGIDRDEETLAEARKLGACDRTCADLKAVRECDLVLVAVPVRSIVPVIRSLVPYCRPGTIISDVGSTKAEICREVAGFLPPHLTFVGGHPMAGSERGGIRAADPYLFQNAVYALTPLPGCSDEALQRLRWMVRLIGAHPLVLGPEEHDRAVAVTSHLPHLVAAALVSTLAGVGETLPEAMQLVGGGFRDTTRIAASDPALWRDICLSNRDGLLKVLSAFQSRLERLREALEAGDGERLESALAAARDVRRSMPLPAKGFMGQLYDVVVHVIDRPGAISEVSGLLAQRQLNIADIEILRVREGEGGTLRLAFESREAMQAALEALAEAGYRARSREGM